MEQHKNEDPKKQSSPNSTLSPLSEAYRKLAPYQNAVTLLIASVGVMTYLGYRLDNKWQTEPWLTVIGAALGIALGFYNFFKIILSLEKKDKE